MSVKTIDDVYGAVFWFGSLIVCLLVLAYAIIVSILAGPAVHRSLLIPLGLLLFSIGCSIAGDGYNRRFWSRLGVNYDDYPGGGT